MLGHPILGVSTPQGEELFEEREGRREQSAGILYISHSLMCPVRVQPKLRRCFPWILGGHWNRSLLGAEQHIHGCHPPSPLGMLPSAPTLSQKSLSHLGGQSPSRRVLGWRCTFQGVMLWACFEAGLEGSRTDVPEPGYCCVWWDGTRGFIPPQECSVQLSWKATASPVPTAVGTHHLCSVKKTPGWVWGVSALFTDQSVNVSNLWAALVSCQVVAGGKYPPTVLPETPKPGWKPLEMQLPYQEDNLFNNCAERRGGSLPEPYGMSIGSAISSPVATRDLCAGCVPLLQPPKRCSSGETRKVWVESGRDWGCTWAVLTGWAVGSETFSLDYSSCCQHHGIRVLLRSSCLGAWHQPRHP